MPGRPPWSQPGTQGGGQTVATQDRPDLVLEEDTQTLDVSAGGFGGLSVYAPQSSVYNLSQMRIDIPAPTGATTGKHYIAMKTMGQFEILVGESNFSDPITFQRSTWTTASNKNLPASEDATIQAVQSAKATENEGLLFTYYNGTDAVQDQSWTIQLVFEERSF